MGREERVQLLDELQDHRGSRVITYVTGDRNPFPAGIAEDAVLPLYRHLLELPEEDSARRTLDLLIYSRGGNVSVPWRIVSMLREFAGRFNVLIPFRAHSAATMIAIGADDIVMGRKGELGPIDPSLNRRGVPEGTGAPQQISVEDVTSYISFMRNRAGLNDQSAVAQVVSQLANHLEPLTIGQVNRLYSHIRLVARKLLSSREEKLDESKAAAVIDALTEKLYSHGHALGRTEAHELGLPVVNADDTTERLIWDLYEDYAAELELEFPVDPEQRLTEAGSDELTVADLILAEIESVQRRDVFKMSVRLARQRQVPPNPTINVNLNLNLPPEIQPNQLPAGIQQFLQGQMQNVTRQVAEIVRQELAKQSPITGMNVTAFGGRWRREQ